MDFPIENGGFFHSYVNVYQRVILNNHWWVQSITVSSGGVSVAGLVIGVHLQFHRMSRMFFFDFSKKETRRGHRIHGAAIYGNMDIINILPVMLAYIYIAAPAGSVMGWSPRSFQDPTWGADETQLYGDQDQGIQVIMGKFHQWLKGFKLKTSECVDWLIEIVYTLW